MKRGFIQHHFRRSIKYYKNGAGFTLIELLVAFTLMSIIVGIGFASFSSYSRRQVVIQSAAEFKQTVHLARFNALSSVKPSVCNEAEVLSSFKVNICLNAICQAPSLDYEMNVTCAGLEKAQAQKRLPQNVTFSNVPANPTCGTLTFNIISGIVSGAPCEIFINGYGNQIKVSIDPNGHVSY